MTRNGIEVWDSVYNEAITTSPVSVSKWSKIKKTIQDIFTQKRSDYWRDYIRCLYINVLNNIVQILHHFMHSWHVANNTK